MNGDGLPPDTNPNDPRLTATSPPEEEVLVADLRAGLTPAQVVEGKLAALLSNVPLALNRVPTNGPRRSFH
jgi:hypothetical protein